MRQGDEKFSPDIFAPVTTASTPLPIAPLDAAGLQNIRLAQL